jgi:hypothetical protein
LLEKEKEIARLKDEFSERLNERWKELKLLKNEYMKENEDLRKQLESQINENAKLKVKIIDYKKNAEGLEKQERVINVIHPILFDNLESEKRPRKTF